MPLLLIFQLCLRSQVTHDIREVVIEGKAEQNALARMKEAGPSSLVISSKDLAVRDLLTIAI